MGVTIRPARESEAASIRQMVLKEGLDPTTLKWQNFLVAEQDGAIIGVGQIKRYRGFQELGSLVVLPDYRGQGIARQLIDALEQIAERPLYLSCMEQMRTYYEQFGYHEIPRKTAPRLLRFKLMIPNTLFRINVIAMRKDG